MKKLMAAGFCWLVCGISMTSRAGMAADPWIGKWEFVSGSVDYDPTPRLIIKFASEEIQITGLDSLGAGGAGSQHVSSARFDGKDYPVSQIKFHVPSKGNTISAKRLDNGGVEITNKLMGKPESIFDYSPSPDRMELINTRKDAQGNTTSTVIYDRSGKQVSSGNPLEGTWIRNTTKSISRNPAAVITIGQEADDSIRLVSGTTGLTAKLDGKESTVKVNGNDQTIAAKRVNARTIEIVSRREDIKSTSTRQYSVSQDGTQMTITESGLTTGTKMKAKRIYRRIPN
jgi:hypothetical protein